MKKFWKKEEKRELTTLELFKLVDEAKTIMDSRLPGFPYELSTLLEAYAVTNRIPYHGSNTYCQVLDMHRIMEHLKK